VTSIRAHFDGKAFIPDEPVTLPPQQQVYLQYEPVRRGETPDDRQVRERLEMLELIARKAAEHDAPDADFSRDSIYPGELDDPH